MHFTGRTWRPPYEANSVIIQAASGCPYRKCRFCSLYKDECFRMSPMEEFEEDLAEIKSYQPNARHIFWTGGQFYSRRREGANAGVTGVYPKFADTDAPFCQIQFKLLSGHCLSAEGAGFCGQ